MIFHSRYWIFKPSGIIDGFGSLGAIFGPLSGSLLLQYTSQGWMWVFVVVAVAMFVAAIVLSRQVYIMGQNIP